MLLLLWKSGRFRNQCRPRASRKTATEMAGASGLMDCFSEIICRPGGCQHWQGQEWFSPCKSLLVCHSSPWWRAAFTGVIMSVITGVKAKGFFLNLENSRETQLLPFNWYLLGTAIPWKTVRTLVYLKLLLLLFLEFNFHSVSQSLARFKDGRWHTL